MKAKLLSTGTLIIILIITSLGLSPSPVAGQNFAPEAITASPTVPGAQWSTYTVESQGNVGLYASLALDPGTGLPSISYYDLTTKQLHQANRLTTSTGGNCGPNSQWKCFTTNESPKDVGRFSSIAFRQSG